MHWRNERRETMPDQKTIERIQQERHTANHAQIYEKKKQCEELDKELEEKKKLGYEVGRMQMKQDNDLLNQQTEMIKQELKDCINDKEYKCIKFMSDDKEYMSALNSAKILNDIDLQYLINTLEDVLNERK